MSVRVSTWVWHETTAKGSDLIVLLALADIADDEGHCYPSIKFLAEKCRMGRATVFRRLDVLEEGGLIERIRNGKRLNNDYLIAVPWAVRSQVETSVRSHIETGEVSPVGRVRSHGRDHKEPSVDTSVDTSSRKRPSTTIPEGWKPTHAHAELAAQRGLDLSSEAFRFRAHADANDRRLVNWDAGFRMWLSKATPDPRQGQRSAWDRAQRMGER